MIESLVAALTDANVLLASGVALLAGVVSFASPCVVPLVPGYLSYMSGLSGAELASGRGGSRVRVAVGGILFTLGFAIPFAALGATAGRLSFLLSARPAQIVMGIVVMLLGVAFTGLLGFDLLRREARVSDKAIDNGLVGAVPLGFVFGVGWVPCIGPALTAIFGLAIGSGANAARGAFLAFVFALGLGLPFVVFGLAFHRASAALGFLQRNARGIQIAGGLMIVAVGLALATGAWDAAVNAMRPWIQGFEPPL